MKTSFSSWETFFFVAVVLIFGCTQNKNISVLNRAAEKESSADVASALGTVASAMSGRTTNAADLKNLARNMQKDEGARSAVSAIAGSLQGGQPVGKYCPVDGKHFDARLTRCPEHNVELLPIKE